MSLVINFLTGAPRPPATVPVDPPTGGDGRFGDLLDNLWTREAQSGSFLGDALGSGDDPAPERGTTVADMFNQHGVLAEPAPMPLAAALPAAPMSSPVAEATPAGGGDDAAPSSSAWAVSAGSAAIPVTADGKPDAGIAPVVAIAPAQSTPIFADAGSVASAHGDQSVPDHAMPVAARPAITVPPVVVRTPAAPVVRGTPEIGNDIGVPDDMAPPAPAKRDPRESGAAAGTQLSLHLAEQGAVVVARLVEAGTTERLRLRDRIAALLSRHGLRAHDIRLDGRPSSTVADQPSEEC